MSIRNLYDVHFVVSTSGWCCPKCNWVDWRGRRGAGGNISKQHQQIANFRRRAQKKLYCNHIWEISNKWDLIKNYDWRVILCYMMRIYSKYHFHYILQIISTRLNFTAILASLWRVEQIRSSPAFRPRQHQPILIIRRRMIFFGRRMIWWLSQSEPLLQLSHAPSTEL